VKRVTFGGQELHAPSSRIVDAPLARRVVLAGVARSAGPILVSPTGHECVAYHVIVTRHAGALWAAFEKRESCELFLDDGTGRVLVRPSGLELLLRGEARWGSIENSPGVLELARAHGVTPEKHPGASYLERRLPLGARAVAAGCLRRERDPRGEGGDYREVGELLSLGSDDDLPVLLADSLG
jgi:hypothetical protein